MCTLDSHVHVVSDGRLTGSACARCVTHFTHSGGGTLLQIAEREKKKRPFLCQTTRLAHCPPLSSCTIAASTCAKHMPTCVVGWARSALAGGLRQREPNSAPGHSDVCSCVLDNVWCVEVQLPNRPQNSAGDIRNCRRQKCHRKISWLTEVAVSALCSSVW
jgi:hypothetical protein